MQSKQDSKERKVRRFADFVALSVSVLDEAEEGTGEGKWRGEDDEDTLVFHGMTMSERVRHNECATQIQSKCDTPLGKLPNIDATSASEI